MTKPISFGKLDFKIVASMEEPLGAPEPEMPFRILILGDFSGRENRCLEESTDVPDGWRVFEVDRDNIDEVMARIGPEIHIPIGGSDVPAVTIGFSELDDFHPDQLFSRLEVFQALRETRKRLNDPRTFETAKKEVRSWFEADESQEPSESLSEPPTHKLAASSQPSGSLLDQIIGETEGLQPDTRIVSEPSDWDAFIRNIVTPHLVPGDDPEQEKLLAAVDASISGLMETLLHHPDFQVLEAAWRAVNFLVQRLETDAQLKLYLLDISKAELATDLLSTEDLRLTRMYKILVEQTVDTPGAEPWAVIAGNYTFDETKGDAELLGRMAKIVKQAGVPFISAAHDHLLGCDSLKDAPDPNDWKRPADAEGNQAWNALRSLPEASYLGLSLPRFLLRLPYGDKTDPMDYFDFQEMPDDRPDHNKYLWGNPCFACVYLLGQAFSQYGWDLRPGVIKDIDGLPLHVYDELGASKIQPCAEVLLTERAAEIIMEKSFMPLVSFLNQDRVRLLRFQSLAHPPTHLAGRWG